jgi:hypothetical protein
MFGGGDSGSNNAGIYFITIASTGNAASFGNLTSSRSYLAAVASSTRAVWAGGASTSSVIDYVTIATSGDAVSFGSLTVARSGVAGVSSGHGGL